MSGEPTSSPQALLERIVNDAAERRAVLERLLQSCREAAAIAPASWAVSQLQNGFRLNVGQVEAFAVFDDGVRLLMAAEKGDARLQGLQVQTTAYRSISGPQSAFAGSPMEYLRARHILDPLHSAYIERAARTNIGKPRHGTPFARYHSPELIEYAAAYLSDVPPERQETRTYPFSVGNTYTRQDVFRVVGVPDHKGGAWFTGYASHGPDWFVFCGVGASGRTGHDYGNHFVGDQLAWTAKGPSRLDQPTMKDLLSPSGEVYIFYREADRDPFVFAGVGYPVEVKDTSPVQVLWALRSPDGLRPPHVLPEEVDKETYLEGASRSVMVNIYERDPNARRRCIAHWGTRCAVCDFDFASAYGELGAGFIHVHHVKPLGEVRAEYRLDPVEDLRPVCANCHAMLHRRQPALELQALRDIMVQIGQPSSRTA